MPLVVRVCADLFENKVNLALSYDAPPPVSDFCSECVSVFSAEGELLRPPHIPPVPRMDFQIHRVQVFDDRACQWADLTSSAQLHDGVQVYIFQPQTSWHTDTQKDLPAPRPPRVPRAAAGGGGGYAPPAYSDPPPAAPSQAAINPAAQPRDSGVAPGAVQQLHVAAGNDGGATEEERVQYLFDEMSADVGHFRYPEFVRWMRELGVDLPEASVQELFGAADLNRDGTVTRDEFRNFSRRYPNVVDVLFHRAADRWDASQREQDNRALEQQLAQHRAQEGDLRQQIDQLERQAAALRQQCDSLGAENESIAERMQRNVDLNHQARERHARLQQEERALMEKEILMERRRDALRDSELEFLQQSQRFDQCASHFGSPRRSRHY